jgi:PAS domain S-box-containing protein
MSGSLQKKVTLFLTLVILLIGAFSTYLFTSAFERSKERGLVARGTALCYSLSKAAEEGLAKEDLDLIEKAAAIVRAPDVTLAQVFTNNWDPVDAYPLGSWKKPPSPEAVGHFKQGSAPLQIKMAGGYDFYAPIVFRVVEDAQPVVIGFVRMTLSSAALQKEKRRLVVTNVTVSVLLTLLAVLALNLLIRRLVLRPVTDLHDSITQFKDGCLPEDADAGGKAADELRELAREFNKMCRAVKENEAKLIESDRRIRSLFERVEHAIFRTNESGTISEANGRFRAMFGNVTELCDVLIGDVNAPNCLRKAAMGQALHIEDKAVSRSGDELFISLSLYAERDEAGNIAGFDGYIIDITEKKRMEERLMRSQKLEAVGTLAAGMAHDFNNLLTGILGYSGIMLKMTREDDPYYKPVSVIHEAAKRGAELGKKILSITRKQKMEAMPVDVNDIISQAVDLLRTSMPGNIELVTKLDPSLPQTIADQSQLHQVIINLAMNGRDAMPDGGRLTLETSVANPANGLSGLVPPRGAGFIKLSVSDTGAGIASGTRGKIFDPFFTTKEVGKGTGLGLYIVHSIVSNHGGYVNLYSEPGQGTRFNVYLPAAKSAAVEAPDAAVDIRGTETVLVIDDEADVRELCKDMLAPLGYTVLLADTGSAGIKLYREKWAEIHLVILDMIMPGRGGNEVFNALKTINKDAVILIYSGYNHNNFAGINELLKSGAAGFFQKPFSLQDIGDAIKKALSA